MTSGLQIRSTEKRKRLFRKILADDMCNKNNKAEKSVNNRKSIEKLPAKEELQ